jgi:parvulin-like peptidyl-prolyl isomerase
VSGTPSPPSRRGAILREPLVWFVLLGGAIGLAWVALAPAGTETIRIEPETLRALEKSQEELLGRPLTDEEREKTQEGFIDDEVLLREALRRGLQWSDGRVRQRLTRIMRASMTETVPDPSVAQLQAHFRENVDKYTTPESVTLEHVVFPWGEDVTEEELAEVLGKLRSGASPKDFGRSLVAVGRRMPRQTRSDLVRILGPDFADAAESLPFGEWQGPVESTRGVHLVRVVERHPPEVATFEAMEQYLRQEWIMTRTRELQQERIDEIRGRYEIEIASE